MSATRALALLLLVAWGGTSTAQTVTLTIEEGRRTAAVAAVSGQPELARRIAAGLLRENRQDRTALIVLAAVEPQLGRPAQGRMAGTRAWRLSTTQTERYEAARLTALAAATEGRFTLSQFWLRRAAANAPTGAALQQTGRDYAGIRRLNPWNLQVGASVSPSSNLNGGSSETWLEIDGEPIFVWGRPIPVADAAQALSGWTYSADVQVLRRLAQDEGSRTALAFRLYGQGAMLSDAAREDAPDAENGDFSAVYTALTLAHDRAAEGGSTGVAATLGGRWYGGDLTYGFVRLGATRRWQGEDVGRAVGGQIEQRWDENGRREALALRLSVQETRAVAPGQLGYGALVERVDGPAGNDRSDALQLFARLTLEDPVGPALVNLSGGVEARHFPDYSALLQVPGGREDLRGWLAVSAGFTDWSYAGFAPVVTVEASRTGSNVSNFESSALSVGLSFRSTF